MPQGRSRRVCVVTLASVWALMLIAASSFCAGSLKNRTMPLTSIKSLAVPHGGANAGNAVPPVQPPLRCSVEDDSGGQLACVVSRPYSVMSALPLVLHGPVTNEAP